MPHDSVSERFSLGAGLEQFLDMPITREAIDAFVTAPCPDHWRQAGTVYRVSNVFATSMGVSAGGRHHHALCGRTLAVGGDSALLLSDQVQVTDVIDDPILCVTLHARDMSENNADVLWRVLGKDPRDAWRVWAASHDDDVRTVCRSLDLYWRHEFAAEYTARKRPQDEPPNWTLQGEFAEALETRHLIVITAHQELTDLYNWLVQWYARACAGSLHAADDGLDDERLALLSIRARGLRYWKRGASTAYGDVRDQRRDAPVEDLTPYCYVSSLYWSFYQLYNSVYADVVKPARCKGTLSDGSPCPFAVPVVYGPGPKPRYCQRCRETRKRERNAERQRRSRERERGEMSTECHAE